MKSSSWLATLVLSLTLLSMQIFELECKDISDEKAKKQIVKIVEKFEQTVRRGTSPLLKLGLRDLPMQNENRITNFPS